MKIDRWDKYESKAIHVLEENEDFSRGTTKSLRKNCGYTCCFYCQRTAKHLTVLMFFSLNPDSHCWLSDWQFFPLSQSNVWHLNFLHCYQSSSLSVHYSQIWSLPAITSLFMLLLAGQLFFFWTFKEISIGSVIVIWHNS